MVMKSILSGLVVLMVSIGSAQGASKSATSPKASPVSAKFDITAGPSQSDWQRFHILTDTERTDLWQYHAKQKLRLKDWAWQWRLGWLRTCGFNIREAYCDSVLLDGLQDAAMVVRAEAATQFAHAHVGSHAAKDVALLEKSYARPDNFRNGKPLFVCEQILRALQEIGGDQALKSAKQLAAKDPHTKKYWSMLMGHSHRSSTQNL